MSKLWTFGCSFTAEYDPIDGIHPPYENNYDKYRKFKGGEFPKTWSNILAEKIGYEIMNCALGGASNYHIFNQFINVCELIQKDDILIFGWTQLGRFIAVNTSENLMSQVLPNDAEYHYLGMSKTTIEEILVNRTHPLWKTEVMNWIKFINVFVEKIGVEAYHWTSDDRIFDAENKEVFNDNRFIVVRDPAAIESNIYVDKHNMMWYLTHQDHYGGIQKGKIMDETNYEIMDGHMGELGHKVQYEMFYDHISHVSKILNK
jgi:hypothetical protein